MREFAANAMAIFVALFFILITIILIRLLSQAAGGGLPPDAVLSLIGFTALNHLGTLLALTLAMSVLMALTRVYRDSEMVVWFASGLPLSAWVAPVLKFALPIATVIGLLSGFLSPWAQGKAQEYRKQLEARDEVSNVSPGIFREDSGGRRVFFVESVTENEAEVKNVFVSMPLADRLRIIVAAHGTVEQKPNGDRFAVLRNGRRYEGHPGSPEFSVTRFDSYAIRIEAKEVGVLELTPRITPTPKLIALPTPPNLGELSWRIGLPLASLVLSLVAVPLSFVNPRAGRALNLLFAVFVFSTYISLLQVMQAWIGQGKIGFLAGLAALHLPMFALMIGMYVHRMQLLSRLFRR